MKIEKREIFFRILLLIILVMTLVLVLVSIVVQKQAVPMTGIPTEDTMLVPVGEAPEKPVISIIAEAEDGEFIGTRYESSGQGFNGSGYPEAPTTTTLSNPNATKEAIDLMDYLNEQSGEYIISGQQSLIHTADVEIITGKKPAIVAFDFIEYSPTRVEHGSSSMDIQQALAWHKTGGIVSFLWHWNSPTKVPNEPGREWWRAFYTEYTDFNLADALADKEGEDYKRLISDMDVIAEHIKVLRLNDVPVLFRPLHEAEGGWFWWGGSGPDAAKELWRIMYDRYVNVHELNNLIWVWNSVEREWYPGDDVVDIVSYDSYPVAGDHSAVTYQYDKLYDLTDGTKYIAMMENGSIPDPDLIKQYGAYWGTFITWNDGFLLDGEHNSREYLYYVYNHPNVITLEDLPRYKARQAEKNK